MRTKEPFGGLSVITVGDLFQLKPVFDQWIFENSKDGYIPLATSLWQQYFKMFELSEVMRQREDKHFAEILNCIREGKHTEADIAINYSFWLKTIVFRKNYSFLKNYSIQLQFSEEKL